VGVEQLVKFLEIERSAIVHHAIARAIGVHFGESGEYIPNVLPERKGIQLEEFQLEEYAYIIQMKPNVIPSFPEISWYLQELIRALCWGGSFFDNEIFEVIARNRSTNNRDDDLAIFLAKAAHEGLDAVESIPSSLTEQTIRGLIRRFSPFEDQGFGTFDEFYAITLVDRLYILFRQIGFYMEREVLGSVTRSVA
jgi:hypothetical protein